MLEVVETVAFTSAWHCTVMLNEVHINVNTKHRVIYIGKVRKAASVLLQLQMLGNLPALQQRNISERDQNI